VPQAADRRLEKAGAWAWGSAGAGVIAVAVLAACGGGGSDSAATTTTERSTSTTVAATTSSTVPLLAPAWESVGTFVASWNEFNQAAMDRGLDDVGIEAADLAADGAWGDLEVLATELHSDGIYLGGVISQEGEVRAVTVAGDPDNPLTRLAFTIAIGVGDAGAVEVVLPPFVELMDGGVVDSISDQAVGSLAYRARIVGAATEGDPLVALTIVDGSLSGADLDIAHRALFDEVVTVIAGDAWSLSGHSARAAAALGTKPARGAREVARRR
jgi:hypothetical protein